MKTIEERIEKIKQEAECDILTMKDHKRTCFKDNGEFDNVINAMHNAQNKDALSKAYYNYINVCICNGYSDGDIIGGIMQNEEQNKKFNVNIDTVIKSLIEIRETPVKLSEPKVEKKNPVKQELAEKPVKEEPAGGVKINENVMKKIKGKLNYIKGLKEKIFSNQSTNMQEDVASIRKTADEAKQLIASIDPTTCTADEIAELNDVSAALNGLVSAMDELKHVVNKQAKQAEAAHNQTGFNIANFIKDAPKNNNRVIGMSQQHEGPKPTAFPHQICGLTDEQIVEEVGKHFKVFEQIPAYPLYDLVNNKLLANKMKEFDSKQRPNNPYLTQVKIDEYIDVPELLQQYSLCFTMPCNDKKQIIVVLFNPIPVPGKNGVLNYPLHIFKAKKNVNK